MKRGKLGIVLDENLTVCEMLQHSPMHGLVQPGDLLLELDGVPLQGRKLADIASRCRRSWRRDKTLTFLHGVGSDYV